MEANSPKTKTSKSDLLGSDRERAAPSKSPFETQMPSGNGGQTSISPPAKVKIDKSDEIQILVSGIDSLYLAMNASWSPCVRIVVA